MSLNINKIKIFKLVQKRNTIGRKYFNKHHNKNILKNLLKKHIIKNYNKMPLLGKEKMIKR